MHSPPPGAPSRWCPVSLVPRTDGTLSPFPHYIDRAEPGIIAIDAIGQRSVNEACPCQEFVPATVASGAPDATCWLIADHRAQRRYGIGAAPPWPRRLTPFQQSGYPVTAPTLRDLAHRIGVDDELGYATARHMAGQIACQHAITADSPGLVNAANPHPACIRNVHGMCTQGRHPDFVQTPRLIQRPQRLGPSARAAPSAAGSCPRIRATDPSGGARGTPGA